MEWGERPDTRGCGSARGGPDRVFRSALRYSRRGGRGLSGVSRGPPRPAAVRHGAHRGGCRRDDRRTACRHGRQWRAPAGLRHPGDRRRSLARRLGHQVDDGHAARRAGRRRTTLGRRHGGGAAAGVRSERRLGSLHAGSSADAHRGRPSELSEERAERLAGDTRGTSRGAAALHRPRSRQGARVALRRALRLFQRRLHDRRPYRRDDGRRRLRIAAARARVRTAS